MGRPGGVVTPARVLAPGAGAVMSLGDLHVSPSSGWPVARLTGEVDLELADVSRDQSLLFVGSDEGIVEPAPLQHVG